MSKSKKPPTRTFDCPECFPHETYFSRARATTCLICGSVLIERPVVQDVPDYLDWLELKHAGEAVPEVYAPGWSKPQPALL